MKNTTKILIIEDEEILVEMYQDKFSEAGFEVFSASNNDEGLRLAKKEKPDLILLDILLPDENGLQFLKRIKQFPEISQIPIIAISNYDELETKMEAYNLGVKVYLIKTQFTPQELLDVVKKYLEK